VYSQNERMQIYRQCWATIYLRESNLPSADRNDQFSHRQYNAISYTLRWEMIGALHSVFSVCVCVCVLDMNRSWYKLDKQLSEVVLYKPYSYQPITPFFVDWINWTIDHNKVLDMRERWGQKVNINLCLSLYLPSSTNKLQFSFGFFMLS
jgi:hypothetical protein